MTGKAHDRDGLGLPAPMLTLNGSQSNIDDNQFRLLAENIPTLCWMANADGYIFWYNRRWHEYCGTQPEEMEGWGWQSVHEPDVLPSVLERWTGCIAAGEPFEMTFPLRGADGVFRPFLTRIQPMRDASGAVQKWFGANVDITAQVAAETELRAANLKKDAIAAEREATLSQLGEGVIITDPSGRITFVNEAAARLHGVARLDVEPEDYTKAYSLWTEDGLPHPVDRLPLTRAVRDQEVVVDARWKIRRPDGSEVLALGNAKPIYAADRSLIGAVLTIRDDTLRHAAEEALAQALRIKDVLLEEVNHRVKNNLQLVSSLLSLQADRTTLPDVRISLLDACSRVGVIAGMHQRLYASNRHDSVNLSTYLHELTIETITALDPEKTIHLNFSGDADFPVALDDAVAIALVINELLTNAVKYAFDSINDREISVSIRREGDQVCITISDNGTGLPEAFDPAASKGLGMLIVSALVGQVNGSMTILPQSKGSAFLLSFPYKRLHDPIKSANQGNDFQNG
jgi:two-component system, sensor histidine kinase PdtaS